MINEIQTKLIESIKNKNKDLTIVLKDIKNNMFQAQKTNKNLNQKNIISILQKMAKQRNQSLQAFEKGNRPDLIKKEKFELSIIESYLPSQLNENDIIKYVNELINNMQDTVTLQNMSKLIGMFNKKYPGQNMKLVSEIIKKQINKEKYE